MPTTIPVNTPNKVRGGIKYNTYPVLTKKYATKIWIKLCTMPPMALVNIILLLRNRFNKNITKKLPIPANRLNIIEKPVPNIMFTINILNNKTIKVLFSPTMYNKITVLIFDRPNLKPYIPKSKGIRYST